MPLIHIQALPMTPSPDVPHLLRTLSHDFAAATGSALEHISATWHTLQPGHYAVGGVTPSSQPSHTHPVLVTVLTPDFWRPAQIENALQAVAHSLARLLPALQSNVFIHHASAHSGQVFDAGRIVHWPSAAQGDAA